ncbi:MAG: hypothetical protein A3K19_29350 [Lentisphaerae bacterium RIFOXYB12_FULL_65_16]|nr:MAG: hypothetical protein A3K18_13295 [Lentisphaerae bacterium RIFOXYA12_64_32]OGV88405.1 MAG: hypothetical protein A3K19_29350 [Lentisphaerae bacterium RIFOXYB12_FULL_65_16]
MTSEGRAITSDAPPCCGGIFPDIEQLEYDQPLRGKAVQVLVQSKGIGPAGRSITVDREQWDRCVACARYRDCYDLSLAKLVLSIAIDGHG